MKKLVSVLMSVLLLAAVFAGCEQGQSAAPATTEDGKFVITYSNGQQPEAMEPVQGSEFAATCIVLWNIYCGLTRVSPEGIVELAYADSYTVSDDGLVWTFHIREDSHWSDGSELNANDWVNGFEYHMRPTVESRGYDLKKYVKNAEAYKLEQCEWEDVGFKALDDHTLEITLENPCTYFLDICSSFIPYKTSIMEENPNWSKNPETYVTNGAFRVTEITDQVGFRTEKNPYYYDAENVHVDGVFFKWIDDPAVELSSYKNGEIDISDNLNAEAEMTYKGTPDYHEYEKIGVRFITMNTEHIPDKRVRQAITYAIDREMLIKIEGCANSPAKGLVPYGIHWNDKQWRDVADEKNGAPVVSYDPEKAKALLAEAGYPNGEGLPTYTYICYNTNTARAQALQNMWKQVGINVEIVPYESSTYWDVFDTEDWDLGDDGWTGDFDDPNTNMFLWEWYREHNADGSLKDARWGNEAATQYDELMKKTYTETDYEARMELFREAEKILLEDQPVAPVYFYNDTMLVNPKIQGIVKSYLGNVYFQYATRAD